MEFLDVYGKVVGIVHKTRREYYIKGWEVRDWDQEGMLILHELLLSIPGLVEDDYNLYRYFKVKFRNYIHDKIRHQESQKRKFDRMPHEEIGGLSHLIGEKGLTLDERYLFWERMQSYESGLSEEERAQYQLFIQGERFNGRSKMRRSLQSHLKDFSY
ncbi:sigma-70 family RNA polymerase sigma factor [Streptococcus cameli]